MDDASAKKADTQITHIDAIDTDLLTPIVRSALDNDTVEVINWKYKQLGGGGNIGPVYRISGDGNDQYRVISWSLVLKILQREGGTTDLYNEGRTTITSWNYYKREALAYQSGWLYHLPGELTAPRSFDIVEYSDGTCWLWLEDLTDDIGTHWPIEHFGVVSKHLGQFNGTYLVEEAKPSWPWLSTNRLRRMVECCAPMMAPLYDKLNHPLIRLYIPEEAREKYFSIWEERDFYFDILDRLPQTLCHLDAYHRNMFARKTLCGNYQTVAVDWAFAGWAAIGAELVPLVQASLAYFEVDLNYAEELEGIIVRGYLDGLHQAGWRGDPRLVRLGYAAASLRYLYVGGMLATILDDKQHDFFPFIFGRSAEECCEYWGKVGMFIISRVDEVKELMKVLD